LPQENIVQKKPYLLFFPDEMVFVHNIVAVWQHVGMRKD
jgi:hypothetical protein